MRKTTITIAFIFFLSLFYGTAISYAQESPGAGGGVTTDSGEGNPSTTIDWPQLNLELSPLEVIGLPPIQLSTGSSGERQTFLQAGESAPWPGVLLNPAAIAYLISEFGAVQQRAQAALELQRNSDWNRLRLEVEQLRLRVVSDRRQADIVVAGLHREVERRIQIHERYVEEQNGGFWNTDFGQVLQWGLVIVGSAAVGLVVGYLAASLN